MYCKYCTVVYRKVECHQQKNSQHVTCLLVHGSLSLTAKRVSSYAESTHIRLAVPYNTPVHTATFSSYRRYDCSRLGSPLYLKKKLCYFVRLCVAERRTR